VPSDSCERWGSVTISVFSKRDQNEEMSAFMTRSRGTAPIGLAPYFGLSRCVPERLCGRSALFRMEHSVSSLLQDYAVWPL